MNIEYRREVERQASVQGEAVAWMTHDDEGGYIDEVLTDALMAEAAAIVKAWEDAPFAIMDTRDVLGICAPTEEGFPALYALQGKRVKIVEV